ncbi:MAG TPA: NifU family protein [Thermoanaerobaculia bacterium]|nr:NifU family protein [Thermoanaerobaculia bacterium]
MSGSTPSADAQPTPQLATLVRDLEALDALFATWDVDQRGAVRAYRTALESLHREAIRRLIAGLKTDHRALALLKESLSDELVYGVLRHFELIKPSLQEKVDAALEQIRPMLGSHGGNVELVRIKLPDTVEVRFLGACDGCAASQLTFVAGVKKAILETCPEIQHVVEVRGLAAAPTGDGRVRFVSPFALGALDSDAEWHFAARLDEIPLGRILRREISGRDLLLSRTGEAIACFSNSCAHLGLPLDEGKISEGILTCPHHGFQYSLETGECLTAPLVQLEQHAVRLIENRVEIRLSR